MPIYPSSHDWGTGSQDWEIVPTDWWRTHYSTVSWVYIQDPVEDKRFQHRQYQGSLFPGPLLVHVTSLGRPSSKGDARDHGETALNVELVGVKGALEAVVSYETSVGFYYQDFPQIEPEELESLIALNFSTRIVNVDDTRVHQMRWNELLIDLMHSPLPESPSDCDEASELGASSSSIEDSLLHSTSTLSSVDLTSSEGSLESQPMPSTPRAKLSLHNSVEVKDTSPTGSIRVSPIRSLSALASSFIPTSSYSSSNDDPILFPLVQESSRTSSKLSSFADFIFPSLNPPMSASGSSSVKLKKDSEGFFTEESSSTTPTPLLPPFLQESSQRNPRTRKSRTREIVDRLRSESVPNEERSCNLPKGRPTVSPKYASYSPSPQLLDDFALSLIKPRRSLSEDGSGEQRQHRQTSSTTSFSASASASTSRLSTPEMEDDDGWIDIADPSLSRSSPKDKLKRTRELFLALTRRRADSISSEVLNEMIDQNTTQVPEGATAVPEDISISSPSPPSTPPRRDVIRGGSTPPSIARTGTTSNDGWIETSSMVHDNSSKVQQKEKAPKKETYYRKKSHNNNPGRSSTHLWARGPAFQPTPPAMPPHSLHPPNLPLSSFPPSSTSTAFSRPPILASHMIPAPTTAATGPGSMPYFFPSYPNLPMSLRMPPVTPVNYSTTAYNAMNVPNVYPMPPPPVPLHSYLAAPLTFSPGGYVHPSTSMSTKTPGFTTAHSSTVSAPSLPMPLSGGAGYSSLNGYMGKW